MPAQRKSLIGISLCTAVSILAQAAEPVPGMSPRYCNPLPIVSGGGASASGDVTVIRDTGKYYMYCTGGGAWMSSDLVNWTFQPVTNVPVAPHVVKYNGTKRENRRPQHDLRGNPADTMPIHPADDDQLAAHDITGNH
jgi:hypothetical protein